MSKKASKSRFKVKDKCFALWNQDGKYYACKVLVVNKVGSQFVYDILFIQDKIQAKAVPEHELKTQDEAIEINSQNINNPPKKSQLSQPKLSFTSQSSTYTQITRGEIDVGIRKPKNNNNNNNININNIDNNIDNNDNINNDNNDNINKNDDNDGKEDDEEYEQPDSRTTHSKFASHFELTQDVAESGCSYFHLYIAKYNF
jgi:hypothetical protein